MKKQTLNTLVLRLRICILALAAVIACAFLFSFTVNKITGDFLKQLGINKTDADSKIINGFIGGYVDVYGIKNIKNIAVGNRTAITLDLLQYAKQQINTPAFKKEYEALRQSNKPTPATLQTPQEMKKEMIDRYKKAIQETEVSVKQADASVKPIFEQTLVTMKEELKKAEDPNNKQMKSYEKNYPAMAKQTEQSNEYQLKQWNEKYPESALPFIKQRLQQFLDETADIDFTAELKTKNNMKVFVNPVYEGKGDRWKMAFRAGKEVVTPARKFIQDWLAELN
ncbi:MAG: hypothetical protein QM791_06365 [Ferruginibacter sp.]